MVKTSKLKTETKNIWESYELGEFAIATQPVYLSNWLRYVNSVAHVVVPVKIGRKRKHIRLKIEYSARVPTHKPIKSFQIQTVQSFTVTHTHTLSHSIWFREYKFNIKNLILSWREWLSQLANCGTENSQSSIQIDTKRAQTHTRTPTATYLNQIRRQLRIATASIVLTCVYTYVERKHKLFRSRIRRFNCLFIFM